MIFPVKFGFNQNMAAPKCSHILNRDVLKQNEGMEQTPEDLKKKWE